MKKLILVILLSIICQFGYSEVVLHRYYDIASGEERGIAYSDKDGNPAVQNPAWAYDVINENEKDNFIELRNKQLKTQRERQEKEHKEKLKRVKDKLRESGLGLSQDDLDEVIK